MPALPYHCLAFPLCLLIIFAFQIGNVAYAGTLPPGAPCSPAHDHLDLISHKFVSQCSDLTFCRTSNNGTVGDFNNTLSGGGGNGTCAPRLCRRDEFPFGYDHEEDIYGVDVQPDLPPMCAQGMYCPDEGSGCKSVLLPGQKCQMGRDEQCDQRYSSTWLSEPNDTVNITINLAMSFRDEDGGAVGSSGSSFGTEKVFQIPSQLHSNELGADELKNETGGGESQTVRVLCLLQTCTVARIGFDEPCIFENTTYASYDAQGVLVEYNIYRDNCLSNGELFCGAESKQCERKKELGWSCTTDVECASFNCMRGICTRSPETPYVVAPWQYALTILTIVGATASTFTILMLLHKRHRARRYREIGEYYAEQLRFRNAIIALHTNAAEVLDYESDLPILHRYQKNK